MKIIAFGASSSKTSINKQLAGYVAQHFSSELDVLDLNDYPLPLYSLDLESEEGIPDNVKRFDEKIQSADLIIISLAEHNGTYTAAFKNLFDWHSRLNYKMFENKKLILLSTSPGARGGQSVMDSALLHMPFHGAEIVNSFVLPSFNDNFHPEEGIKDQELKRKFDEFIAHTTASIS